MAAGALAIVYSLYSGNLYILRVRRIFFNDRIERRWFLFGTRILKFDEIEVVFTFMNMHIFNNRTIAFGNMSQYANKLIRLDRNLISRKTEKTIIEFLANISCWDISEFQEVTLISPFIKQIQQGV